MFSRSAVQTSRQVVKGLVQTALKSKVVEHRLISSLLFSSPSASSSSTRASSFSTVAKRNALAAGDVFVPRHLGPSTDADIEHMLKTIGYKSVTALIKDTVPGSILKDKLMNLPSGLTEQEALTEFKQLMSQNKVFRSHIGRGYYNNYTPTVILRNILENPGWYTPYTPYQAEVAQGRLEMLLNYQTMISDLTGLPVSNASLLDEATAAAEAMSMFFNPQGKKNVFLVSTNVFPQSIAVIKTRAQHIGVQVKVMHHKDFDFSTGDVFGCMVQYPADDGTVEDLKPIVEKAHAADARVSVAADLLSLTVLTPPGEWGADVVLGSAQRFGVPIGFGGPHAAFLATTEAFKRKIPGRIIGVSKDSRGKPALRMAMQTREQHIRREKATSNICTAQALLANMAAAYGIYHGPAGLKKIAERVHAHARVFAHGVSNTKGLKVANGTFFDTVNIFVGDNKADALINKAAEKNINLRKVDASHVAVAFDETSTSTHIDDLFGLLNVQHKADQLVESVDISVPAAFRRTSNYLTHPVFNMYHCEHEMLRYLYRLQMKDLSLCTAMIPLGSCTMKLNSTSEMIPVTWPEVGQLHPYAPENQLKGYKDMLNNLKGWLSEITGFHTVSLQPNAGSQGEYAGLLAISAYHKANGNHQRDICLIPTSAHGTNPASAVMAGMQVVVVKCDNNGEIDMKDLAEKATKHKDNLSCLMVTYPSTHGVFEDNIKEICQLIHSNGGQVYMDGANMNAQVGLCSPGAIGADVCHLNLHKTFCIPHGGGGPGMGPIGVAKHLAPFLPGHPFDPSWEHNKHVGPVSGSAFSSASILPISYMYIRMMGPDGLRKATEVAILNANYMAKRLKNHFRILYTGKSGTVAHEFIIDLRDFKPHVSEEDVAKRLQDFNFHAPTMSWPVPGTLMVEPTESESLYELDRFCDAMITIRAEIQEILDGKADPKDNVLKNAPHTADTVLSDTWAHAYGREKAAYPLAYLRQSKFWPTVGRLDNVYGDRNVVCTCPPLESYSSE